MDRWKPLELLIWLRCCGARRVVDKSVSRFEDLIRHDESAGRLLTGQTTTGYTDAATSRELNPDETDYYEQNNFYVVELYANQLFNMLFLEPISFWVVASNGYKQLF